MAEENYLKTILSNKFLKGLLSVALVAIISFIVVLMGIVIIKTLNNQYVKIGPIEFNLPPDSNRNEKIYLETKPIITSAKPTTEPISKANTSTNNLKSSSVTVTGNITGKNIVAGTNNGNVGDQTYNINTLQRKLNDTVQNELLQCIDFYMTVYNKTRQNYPITIGIFLKRNIETQTFAEDISNILSLQGFNVKIEDRNNNISPIPIGWDCYFSKDGLIINIYNYSEKIMKPC